MKRSECQSDIVRVCFISPKAYPLFNPNADGTIGGAEVDLYLLATELAKDQNYRVSCITADYGQSPEEIIENVRVIKSLDFKQNQFTGALKIWKAMKTEDADIYMMESASPGVPLTAAFCKIQGKKFVYRTAHQEECEGTYLKNHFLLGRLFIKSLRNAEVITQNCQDQENLKKTTCLDSTVVRNAHRLPDVNLLERNKILWAGRSIEFKKPRRFFDLANKFPQEQFVMICQKATGDNNYEDLKLEAGRLPNLEFIERVPFDEIDGYFKTAKVFVSTSDSEGFPNTFIQAAKASTAILSYKVNPDDFLNKYSCGKVCDGNFDLMVDSLNSLLRKNHFREAGRNGRKYVEENHDIALIIGIYKSIFERVLNCQ